MKNEYHFLIEIDDGDYSNYCLFKKCFKSLQDCNFIANETGVHNQIDCWIEALKNEEIDIADKDFTDVKVFTKGKTVFLEVNYCLFKVLEMGVKSDQYSCNLIFNIVRADKENYKEYDGKLKRQDGNLKED